MITPIQNADEILSLNCGDIYGGKIISLCRAYGTDYDFCRFYRQNKLLLCSFYGEFIVAGECGNFDELADFLSFAGAKNALVPQAVKSGLESFFSFAEHSLYRLKKAEIPPILVNENPKLDDVYSILRHSFKVDFSAWYVDMSHRIRRGITKVFTHENATTLTAQFDEGGVILLSQIATLPERRGEGLSSLLLRAIAGEYKNNGKAVFVICRRELQPFYEKNGFVLVGKSYTII